MFQVLGLRKVGNADPQEFELSLKDLENKKQGYLGRTGYGTEAKVRARLKDSGISEFEIEKLFKNAQAV